MGEDREIGASVLAGARARPVPHRPRCSVRRVSAGRGHLTRRGQAWSDGNGGRARSLAALARGALARLPSLRCACGLPCGRSRGRGVRAVGRVRPCPASSRRHRPQIPNRCQVRRCGHVAFFLRDKHTRRSPAGPAARRQTRAPCHRDGAAHAAPLRECPVDEPLGPACSRSSH